MYIILLLGFFILNIQTSVSQYPNHMDFQKVGEVIFNNEKYNVLTPTTHSVSDYFKEFMLRRENTNFPTKRVFIDHNGFRHFWSGFGKTTKSLRKTDYIDTNLIDNVKRTVTEDETATNDNEAANINDNNTTEKNEQSNETIDKIETIESVDEKEDSETGETITTKILSAAEEKIIKMHTLNGKLRGGKKGDETKANETNKKTEKSTIAEKVTKDEEKPKAATNKKPAKPEQLVAKTTFFCPFFGVITMAAFID